MIEIAGQTYAFDDPRVVAVVAGVVIVLLIVILLIMAVRRAGQSSEVVNAVAMQMGRLTHDVNALSQGQNQLAGNIQTVSDAQANAQIRVIQTMETRLAEVNSQVAEKLADNALRSASN